MPYVKADEVRENQQIMLDMGYGAHNMDEICTVLSTTHGTNLFRDKVCYFKVRRPCGEIISTVSHSPQDKVEVPDEFA